MTFFFFVSSFVSISVPPSSFLYYVATLCLSLFYYTSLFASLFIPPFMFPKNNFLVYIKNFCILGTNWKEWDKRKCKGWNGRKGPTFKLSGLVKLFLKTITLFAKRGINSLMPFLFFFSLDIVSTKKQNVPMDVRRCFVVSSTNCTTTKFTIDSVMLESTPTHSRSKIWP